MKFYLKDRPHAKDFILLNCCLMSYLYVTAGIFPHHNTPFAVPADSMLESVISVSHLSPNKISSSVTPAIKGEMMQLASLRCDCILIVQ